MAENAGESSAAATPRCHFQSPGISFEPAATNRGKAGEKHSSGRLRDPKSPSSVNEDRRVESPTWEDVEDARSTRVRKQSARSRTTTTTFAPGTSTTHSSRASRQSAVFSDRSSTGYLPELSRISEGGETGENSRYLKSTAAHRDRGSPHAHRSGSGIDLGVSNSGRGLRHKHSSLLRRADALANLSSPSLLSVFSSLTHSSGTSSGSNSTVTQKSYERSNITKRRRPKDRSKHSDGQGSSRLGERAERRRRRSSQSAHSQADQRTATVAEIASPLPSRDYPISTKPSAVDRDRVNSDSGISVRDSSPESVERHRMAYQQATTQSYLSPVDEDAQRQLTIQRLVSELSQDAHRGPASEADERLLQRLLAQEEGLRQHILRGPQQPRDHSQYDGGSPPDESTFPYCSAQPQQGPYWGHSDAPPPAPHVPESDPSYMSASYVQYPPQSPFISQFMQRDAPDSTKTTIVGYEKLATKLAERPRDDDGANRSIRPMYRRFEYLNHRILLHIQDELSEMEEELRKLDEYIAQTTTVGDDENAQPASRRLESRYGGDLCSRRTLLLGNIYVKLGQYNNAMTSYGNMIKVLEPAKTADISAYQSWLHKHAPIDEAETRFLERGADLMALPPRGEQHGFGGQAIDTLQSATLALPLFLLLPLIAYSMIPGIGARLFILGIIGAAEVSIVGSTRFYNLIAPREWAVCAAAYFALMVIIAGVV